MEFPQKSRLETLRQILWFLDRYADSLGAVVHSRASAALKSLVPTLEAHAKDQHSADVEAKSKTEIKDELRTDLRVHHMQQIAAIARSRLAGVAQAPVMLKLQYPRENTGDVSLVAAGQSMAEAAQQYEQVFLDEQLPADFIQQLQAATEAVRVATTDRRGSQLRLRAATKGVTVQLQQASHLVRVLNSLVVRQLKRNPELLAAWNMAIRNRKKPGIVRTPAGDPVSQPVQPPVTQPIPQLVATAQPEEVHADS
jgi:hypothetical protein